MVKTPRVASIPRVRGQTSTRTTSAVPSAPENTSLDGSTKGNNLTRANSLGGFLAAKVLLEKLLGLGDTSGTSGEDNLIMGLVTTHEQGQMYTLTSSILLDVGILNLLDGLQGLPEEVHVELFELGAGEPQRSRCHLRSLGVG